MKAESSEAPLQVESILEKHKLLQQMKGSKEWASTPALPFHDGKAIESKEQTLEVRWTLQLRESREFKLEFRPTKEGNFESEFLLTLVDNADETFKIRVEGAADVPRLDVTPASVFDRVSSSVKCYR